MNFNQNNNLKLLLIAQFVYNNAKNTSNSYIIFKLNYNYHFCILYTKNIDFYFQSKLIDKLLAKFQKLMIIY